jgi:ribosomal protein S18 acetylase RimI-like enzyme
MSERPSVAASAIKALHRTRARGPRETSSVLGRRIKEALWSEDELVVWVRPTGGIENAPDPARSLRRADEVDAEDYAKRIGTDSALTFVSRLSDETFCYVVTDEGNIVHSSWVTRYRAWTRELRTYVSPPQGDAYVYESFTRPEVRGRGVYPFALAGIAADLAGAAGRLWVMVEADNPASIRSVEKAGFERHGSFHVRRRLGRLFIEVRGGPGLRVGRGRVAG